MYIRCGHGNRHVILCINTDGKALQVEFRSICGITGNPLRLLTDFTITYIRRVGHK